MSWWKNRKETEGRRTDNREEKKVETEGRQTNREEQEKKRDIPEEKEGKHRRKEEQ